ncbi:hypothetical protein AS188_00630 [Kocuria flava]|uniref:DNA polymerase III subunit gamma/tau n=1 Tax=Kocuria flava TaxID=446860 RepID=A0A0U3GGK0_9MICC|nr:DNA polymerase III subunit gamma and tau [Kocuria flava]ALU38499.1 hypothetical protein AS188_00630 [Kocuria flava]GEO92504.1 hypothetical protein KFL01_18100 [Kocuria flava]
MTTALYRRYRPETFEDVIGQEHVTEPLMTALRKDRVSHAYLFSGPRGCGKTTSARILARCLNCAEGPTATPCGRCESCRDLARDGAGSLDVIEMDAASHGGVDHARDLRERATFAPVRDRYKIFIIDEAHMVTREGFNALLKIVEEPPEHIKFIFATTEPSKVLTTIRSRTHHYPFRLVPPEPLVHYLEQLCAEEHVQVAPGVLSLVVRAGGGSVRDTLSVLDQLMAGSDEQGITYDLAVALLGYTHGALLDDVVDAFASGDAATVFRAVDRVVQTGQDPRRFVEDLLQRFRDLVIVNAVPDSAGNILHGMPQDQVARLRNQASQLGAAELSRAADITNTALTEMTGATSPQLHLELLCARILLPSSEDTTRGVTARVDRIERRLGIGRGAAPADQHAPAAPAAEPAPAPSAVPPAPRPDGEDRGPAGAAPAAPPAGEAAPPEPTPRQPAPAHAAAGDRSGDDARHRAGGAQGDDGAPRAPEPHGAPAGGPDPRSRPDPGPSGPVRPGAAAPEPQEDTPRAADGAGTEIDLLRASWPEIVNALAEIRRVAWFTVQRGTPQSFDGKVLRIMFDAEGDLMNFPRFEDDLRRAVHQVLGIDCRAEAVPPGGGHGRGGGSRRPGPPAPPRGGQDGPAPERRPEQRGGRGPEQDAAPRQDPGAAQQHDRGTAHRAERSPAPRGEQRAVQRPEPGAAQPGRAGAPGRRDDGPAGSGTSAGQEPPRGDRDARGAPGRPATDEAPEWSDPSWAEEPVHSWSVAPIPGGAAADGSVPVEDGAPGPVPADPGPGRSARPGAPAAPEAGRPAGDHGTTAAAGPGVRAPDAPEPGHRGPDTPGTAARPADEHRADDRQPAHRRADDRGPGAQGPAGGEPTEQDAAGPDPAGRAPARQRPTGGGTEVTAPAPAPAGGGPEAWRPGPSDDDVPPPEEPPYPDDLPYPDAPYPDEPPPPEDEAPPEQWRPSRPAPAGPAGPGRTAPPAPAHRERPAPGAASVATAPAPERAAPPAPGGPAAAPAQEPASRRRLSFRERHAAAIAAGRQAPERPGTAGGEGPEGVEWDDSFVPSADDEALEDSTLYGRAAIERILGGMLIEERDLSTGE